jgi:hypothetical protein
VGLACGLLLGLALASLFERRGQGRSVLKDAGPNNIRAFKLDTVTGKTWMLSSSGTNAFESPVLSHGEFSDLVPGQRPPQ